MFIAFYWYFGGRFVVLEGGMSVNLLNNKIKIVGLFVLSIIMFSAYWYIDNSTELNNFKKKADRVRADWGFGFYAIIGLLKYGLLITGASIFIIVTTLLITKRTKTKQNKN